VQAAVLAGNDFRAAATDVADQHPPLALRPDALHAQVNQPRFLAAGDDFHVRPGRLRSPFQKFALVSRVADGAGRYRPHAHHRQLAVERGHPHQHRAGRLDRFLAHRAVAKHAFAQTRHFAVGRQHTGRLPAGNLGGFHADRVAADVDGCVSGHLSSI